MEGNRKKILRSGEYTGHIENIINVKGALVSNTLYSNNYIPHWHYHENMNMCLVFANSKSETSRDANYSTNKGGLFFYHSGQRHRNTVYENNSKSINVEFPLDYLNTIELKVEDVEKSIYQCINIKSIFLRLYQELQQSPKQELLPNIEFLLLELLSANTNSSKNPPLWIIQLKEYMHDNWNKPYDVDCLSSVLKVHPVSISKYFRRYFHCTFSEYRRKIKVEKSIGLIRKNDISLTEVAYECGFADQSHFIRSFKKCTGFLPKNVRQY